MRAAPLRDALMTDYACQRTINRIDVAAWIHRRGLGNIIFVIVGELTALIIGTGMDIP